MKIAYLDCASGIAGDMLLGALVDAGAPLEEIQAAIDSLRLPSCRLVANEVRRGGFRAIKIDVEHEPEHAHRHPHHIVDMIRASQLTPRQQELAERVFTRLGEAEAKVHGTTIRKVHFHEVGAVDSIADIVGTAVGLDLLGIQRIVASPVPTGRGFIEIAHGRCSIPAPATAELLRGMPLAQCDVEAELTTPTGAAVLAALADGFGGLPAMWIETIGCGAGTRELENQPNLLRLLLGVADTAGASSEEIVVLETNLDDATGQQIGHCVGELLRLGALDAYTTPIQMKKGRPGVLLTVLCRVADADALRETLFRQTPTFGVRWTTAQRRVLRREHHSVQTRFGTVEGMVAWREGIGATFSPEYEACRQIADARNVPLAEVQQAAMMAFDPASVRAE
ncbi:MAG: nickel pincer cofactor biosynthesis protein LarC [Planctomycetes bacterium]|nr:nickel pincer cofactor biosynthesis protein LarC [Planctomycetota bacterium]